MGSPKRPRRRRMPLAKPPHPLDFARASFTPGDPHRSDEAILGGSMVIVPPKEK